MHAFGRTTRIVASSAVVLMVIAACNSLYDRPTTPASSSGSGVVAAIETGLVDASGYFPPGSHDVLGADLVRAGALDPDVGAATESFFRTIQIDPASEDTAGPKFVVAGDIDRDGLLDLATGWNQSQPIQIHLQRRELNEDGEEVIRFLAATIAGTTPVVVLAGIELADMDRDGWLDVVALVKQTGFGTFCVDLTGEDEIVPLDADEGELIIYFNPGDASQITDGDTWLQVELGRSIENGRRDISEEEARFRPENNGYTALAVGDVDGINGPDIVVAYNPAECDAEGELPPLNRIELFANPGNDFASNPGDPPLTVVANAGVDQNVGIPANPDGIPPLVTLDGTSSFASDGNGLWYEWEQIFGLAVDLDFATTPAPEFFGPTVDAVLQFRLTVRSLSDPTVSDFDIVTLFFGLADDLPPLVIAGEDQVVIPLRNTPPEADPAAAEVVTLTGEGSVDSGLALGETGLLTYEWTQTFGPTVVLNGPTTLMPTFDAPSTPETLRFRLVATDEGGLQETDFVEVLVRQWAPVWVTFNLPAVKDCVLLDVEDDGDLDIVYTYPDSVSGNVSWSRNPREPTDASDGLPGRDLILDGFFAWEERPIGQVDTHADTLSVGDVDGDGFEDILVRSTVGSVVQWFRRPTEDVVQPIFPPPDPLPDRFNFPWQVFTMFEFNAAEPVATATGDLTGDGRVEAVIGTGSGVSWYAPPIVTQSDGQKVAQPFDPWTANVIVRDDSGSSGDGEALAIVNKVLIVDLDGDGQSDFIATLDRQGQSGLSNDALIWYRNVIGEEND